MASTRRARTAKSPVRAASTKSPKSPKQRANGRGEAQTPRTPGGRQEETRDPDAVLRATLDQMRIRKTERSECSEVINAVIRGVELHLKRQTDCFGQVARMRTGSYYENLKICHPDEADVMYGITAENVVVQPFGEDGAFYTVAIRERSRSHPLSAFVQDGVISASMMLKKFRGHVQHAVKKEFESADVRLERKKKGCPAVTLYITKNNVNISLDLVLGLNVKARWPSITDQGFAIEGWLGTKVKKTLKFSPFLLVPKYEGNGNKESNGARAKDAWRISFSHVEKEILKNHGATKTCCEAVGKKCCRRECLKLLKHLLERLKAEKPNELSDFCSYHAKTALLHVCTRRVDDSQWRMEDLSRCFQRFLQDFQQMLRSGNLPNFFIPTQNLLSPKCTKRCSDLADCIEEQVNNMFPIFQQE